jgi:hypothetical protein
MSNRKADKFEMALPFQWSLNSSSGSDAAHDVEAEIYRKMGKRKTNYLKIQKKSRPHFISNSMVY